MLIDGIELAGSSYAKNFTVESGDSLPQDENSLGEIFFKTGTDAGLYIFDDGWQKVVAEAYDIAFSAGGLLGSGRMFITGVSRAFLLPSGLPGSVATALTPAAAETILTLYRKPASGAAVSIGTLTFAAGSSTGVFAFPLATNFAPGDVFYADVAAADTTLADVSVTLNGTLI